MKSITEIFKNLSKEDCIKIVKSALGPSHRELSGEEYDHVWLILQFLTPAVIWNNQQTSTEEYKHAGKTYQVHYGVYKDRPMIEEVGELED